MNNTEKHGGLADFAHEQLLALIAQPQWAKDGRLPSETELARRIGVSRPVLRMGLARLKAEGKVLSRRGSGNFVVKGAAQDMSLFGPLRNIPDIQRCLEFRGVIECEAAACAADLHDSQLIAAVEQAQADMRQAAATDENSIEIDFAFHLQVSQATRNRFFITTLSLLKPQVLFGIELARRLPTRQTDKPLENVCEEHDVIVAAIAAGDPEAARQAMADHLHAGIQRLFGE